MTSAEANIDVGYSNIGRCGYHERPLLVDVFLMADGGDVNNGRYCSVAFIFSVACSVDVISARYCSAHCNSVALLMTSETAHSNSVFNGARYC